MSNRLRIALVLIGAVGVEGIIMGVFARAEPSEYQGVPGSLGVVVAVVAAILAGPLVGAVTALLGGLLFLLIVTHGGLGAELAVILWAGCAAIAGVIARRYRGLSRQRDAALESERAGRRESERARARAARLQALTAALVGALSSEDAVGAVGRQAVNAVGASGFAIGLVDGSGRSLEVTFASAGGDEMSRRRLPLDASVSLCEVVRTGQALDLESSTRSERAPDGHALLGHLGDRLVVRPLEAGGERLGAIALAFPEHRDLGDEDRDLLDVVAGQVSLAVRRVRSFEAEHQIAATLQDSLLPHEIVTVPGFTFSTRYMAGAEGMEIGGDWYDVVGLPDGSVYIAVGDVRGRGLSASVAMGQMRNAWRALATQGELSPAALLSALDRFVHESRGTELTTIVTARVDPAEGRFEFASAGHPPPLVIGPGRASRYLEGGLSMPLGVPWEAHREDQRGSLPAGATLMLYTDGLIERRGEPIDRGFQRLKDTAAARSADDLDQLGDALSRLIPRRHGDDVAMLFLRASSSAVRFERRFTADPGELAALRHAMRRWLDDLGVRDHLSDDVVLACGEAASNAIEHAYLDSTGDVSVTLRLGRGRSLVAEVTDRGHWRPPGSDPFRGRGIGLMRSVMDAVDLATGSEGTKVSMRKALAPLPAFA